ncbi:MAG: DUF5069 domain-containing protein [Candidatus Eremiobacter antarcticus]|nr:DUF5069 domain-containing protein [Candidatus Eremiobacteraeota bacterium]MBC5807305.1 DUF5069 domain-containing protein [Candidatus Eremiobacteraeota bacterium]PZR64264.1 MAG: DUF5069 domain-containing protein [Candidatus Eremiobacter sp. RRmetagenome_bin22]
MDLTKNIPRSPNERLLGIPMLPRTIDKARAALAGSLGEYVYGDKSSFDTALLSFLGISAAEFSEGVRTSPDDESMSRWVQAHARDVTPSAVDEFVNNFLNDGDNDEERARFAERRAKLPESVRPKVTRWTDLLDVAEGRIN